MRNLWGVTAILLIGAVGMIILIIHITVTKEKHWAFCDIFLSILMIIVLIGHIPYIKDLRYGETTVITAEYIDYISPRTFSLTRTLKFKFNGQEIKFEVPKGSNYHLELESGKIYQVEYFDNSKVVKSFEQVK